MEQISKIESRIFTIRGLQVMLDNDISAMYHVEVKRLNEQVRRNIARFPEEFRFQLTEPEFKGLTLRSQIATSNERGGRRYLPYVFTEQGIAMLATVLHSDMAIKVSIQIMKVFVAMRRILSTNTGFIQRLETVEIKQIETDKKVETLFKAWENKDAIPKCGVFFDGQIFDAYVLANNIIKSAKQSIILIDNYIDDSVLTMFGKKSKNVKVTLLSKNISKQLSLDVDKFNLQYSNTIEAKIFDLSHDRFLIIDGKEVYHLGASLKDLGKRWFAFSKMEPGGLGLLEKLPFPID
ncbi:MAG: ORF6N domain-containing protein [Fibromonadales bacterium]|nr:ORF6N domain-containing protein [Fibromonadales bacterium]